MAADPAGVAGVGLPHVAAPPAAQCRQGTEPVGSAAAASAARSGTGV
jgi:hypothetical protein